MTTLYSNESLHLNIFLLKVSTCNSYAQELFNKGLIQMYGFNHEDAIRFYLQSLEYDCNLAISHWGISYCYNINYNNNEGLDRSLSLYHYNKAKEIIKENESSISQYEKDIINSMNERFNINKPIESQNRDDILLLERNYGNILKDLYYKKYNNDPNFSLIYAECLMNKRPWILWNKDINGKYHEESYEIQKVLELGIKNNPKHPGLLHLYIHLMELSPTPEKAEKVADTLVNIDIEQGHLIHMGTHIYMWIGNYEASIYYNIKAIEADDKYVRIRGTPCEFYKFYRCHNIHFCVWAAMYDGQYNTALTYAKRLQKETSIDVLNKLPGPDYLDSYSVVYWHVYIRFGKWNEIINEIIPTDTENYPALISTCYYAKGIAYASLGDIINAEEYYSLFIKSLENPKLRTRIMFNDHLYNGKEGIFTIGKYMLQGEIEYRKENYNNAFCLLKKAVDYCDNIIYDEPWGWMIPPRHALGALLLERGYIDEAIQVYKNDLEINKNNLWSTGGLLNCYKQKNNNNNENIIIKELEIKLKEQTKRSDISFTASCYCALSAGAKVKKCC